METLIGKKCSKIGLDLEVTLTEAEKGDFSEFQEHIMKPHYELEKFEA